jgi:hypothetical protein
MPSRRSLCWLISLERDWPDKTGFALYQGPTFSRAVEANKELGFSPCGRPSQNQRLKPNSLSILYGPTKVGP